MPEDKFIENFKSVDLLIVYPCLSSDMQLTRSILPISFQFRLFSETHLALKDQRRGIVLPITLNIGNQYICRDDGTSELINLGGLHFSSIVRTTL